MISHSYLGNISSEERENEGGASTYESDIVNEVHNLPSDKICDAIKMLSRFLCKLRNKFVDKKQIKNNLEN